MEPDLNAISENSRYVTRLIATGSFLDADTNCMVQTYIVCLSYEAMQTWIAAHNPEDIVSGPSWDAWHPNETRQEFRAHKAQLLNALEERVAVELGVDMTTGSFCVERVVGEIFAAVYMHERGETCTS